MPMWRKNTWCLALIAGILLVLIGCVSGIRINEVAPKTPEFVEIYNPDSELLNLSEWKIKDSSTDNPDTITCWTMENCSLITNLVYFIIIGRNTNILDITSQPIAYFYVDDSAIGNGLTDSGDNITFFNSIFTTSFGYNNSETNMSWQFCDNSWQSYSPTPGSANYCSASPQICIQNWNCSAWSSCINGEQTRSCIDLNNCLNATGKPSESQSCATNTSIYLELDYASEIQNGEFEITAKLYNLQEKDYDIKVYVTFEENDTVISETYNKNEWKSSTYYINDIVSGTGNKTLNVKLRIADKYSGFRGNAKINARLRESISSSTVANFEDDINILERENSSSQSSNQGTVTLNLLSNSSNNDSNGGVGLTSNVIKLNSPSSTSTNTTKDIKSNIVYKSKVEYFKEYGFYALGIVCIVIIFVLLRK